MTPPVWNPYMTDSSDQYSSLHHDTKQKTFSSCRCRHEAKGASVFRRPKYPANKRQQLDLEQVTEGGSNACNYLNDRNCWRTDISVKDISEWLPTQQVNEWRPTQQMCAAAVQEVLVLYECHVPAWRHFDSTYDLDMCRDVNKTHRCEKPQRARASRWSLSRAASSTIAAASDGHASCCKSMPLAAALASTSCSVVLASR